MGQKNNLKLNSRKLLEMIVRHPRAAAGIIIPPSIPGISKMTAFNILGVTKQDTLSMRVQ